MLEPSLCEREPLSWLGIKALVAQGLSTPELMIPLLIGLCLSSVGLLSRQWRWLGVGIASAPLLIYLVLPLPWVGIGLEWGLTRWVPPDPGQPTDAIVVLGRGALMRPWQEMTVQDLWEQHRAPLILASGKEDGPRLEQRFQEIGIPEDQVISEGCSQTTYENARCAAALLQPSADRILLVTDGPHLLRSWLTFRAFGFSVIPHFTEVPAPSRSYEFPLTSLREYAGLVSYWGLGRFAPQPQDAPAICQ